MESDRTAIHQEEYMDTLTSSIPNSETTLIPQLSPRPPEEVYVSNNESNEISEIKTSQPCVEIDGASHDSSSKKTPQDFSEKVMVNMDDCTETDNKSKFSGTDVLRKDSNENITPELDEEGKLPDFSVISAKVGTITFYLI
jgi:hypothetical protein